jgi:hypothetical protein
LIRENLRGSLERLPGRTGMGDARPLDRDQRALVEGVCGFYSDPLIVDRAARTKGEKKQGPAVATARRRRLPRRRFAGDGRSRPSGLYFGWGQAPENARDMRNPPGQMARVYGGRNSSRHGMGGSGRQSSPACTRSRAYGGLRSTTASARGSGRRWGAHQGAERAGTRRRDDFNGGPAVEAIGVRGRSGCRESPSSCSPETNA